MKFWLAFVAAVFVVPTATSQGYSPFQNQLDQPNKTEAAAAKAQDQSEQGNEKLADGKIRFSFVGQPWSEVIPWFAEQAGFSLQTVERWPEGSFNLQDTETYTTLEALDQLNRTLAGLSEPFTLVRNRKTLLLKPANEPINDDLVETVDVKDLDNRGAFEIMTVSFDLGDLDAAQMFAELQALVSERNRGFFFVTPAANRVQVRETGQRLRNIRDTIKIAQKRLDDAKLRTIQYKLKFQDPETFIGLVGGNFGIAAGQNTNANGTFSMRAETLGDRLFVTGNNKTLEEFETLAKLIDSDPKEEIENTQFDAPTIVTYPVSIDPKLALNILETMLEGRDVKMGQDEQTGAITVQGREEDHKVVEESLASVSNSKTSNFEIIQLEKIGAAEALSILQAIYRQDALTDDVISGPVLLANATLNTVIVSGTAREVVETKSTLEKLDKNYIPVDFGPRTTVRMVPMSESEQERLLPILPDLLGSVGRGDNPFKVIRPRDRKSFPDRVRNGELNAPVKEDLPDDLNDLLPPAEPQASSHSATDSWRDQVLALACLAIGPQKMAIATTACLQMDDPVPATNSRPSDYQPPKSVQSVAGAPIEFRFTEYGLTIESEDLDAADDIEAAIQDFLGTAGVIQSPTIFEIKHRPAGEMKQLLEENLGMSDPDSGGGGGGGGGGLLGGMMSNMMGGGGDLMGSLLGGSGGTGGGDIMVEGDVSFVVDARFNHIWVRGATDNDLIAINNMIDRLDMPEGETKPEVQGKTRIIPVFHRDAEELTTIIKSQLPELMYSENAEKGQKSNNEMAQMMQAVQSLTGKKNNANNASNDAMKPKLKLTADKVNNQILVTGPEYQYLVVVDLVEELDQAPPKRATEIIPSVSSLVLDSLKNRFPKLQIGEGEEGQDGASGDGNGSKQQSAADKARAQQTQQIQQRMQQAIQQRIQQSRQQGGERGGRTGGRGGRGGR
jgi:transcriptional regulator with XRE-family HTH domain